MEPFVVPAVGEATRGRAVQRSHQGFHDIPPIQSESVRSSTSPSPGGRGRRGAPPEGGRLDVRRLALQAVAALQGVVEGLQRARRLARGTCRGGGAAAGGGGQAPRRGPARTLRAAGAQAQAEGGHPGTTALTSPTPLGRRSRASSPTALTAAAAATPARTTARSSTASSGTCTPAPLGPTPQDAMVHGKPATTAATAGARTAFEPRSATPCCANSIRPKSASATCGASTAPSTGPTPPPGRKQKPDARPQLGGPEATQLEEPPDHALGRSRGGCSPKVHLVCDRQGIVLAVRVTAGQTHATQGGAQVRNRAHRPRRAGRQRWPDQGAGDKGSSASCVRDWRQRRHLASVLPTPKKQPRQEDFDQAT